MRPLGNTDTVHFRLEQHPEIQEIQGPTHPYRIPEGPSGTTHITLQPIFKSLQDQQPLKLLEEIKTLSLFPAKRFFFIQ